MKTTLDLSADIIDVRDIIERVEELESDAEGSVYESDDVPGKWGFAGCGSDKYETEEAAEEAAKADDDELQTLTAILEDLKGNGGDEQWRGTGIR